MDKVLVIAPVWNEEGKIGQVVREVPKSGIDQIVVVNDGSDDNSALEAENTGALVLTHKQRSGVGAAIRTGIEYAINNDYEIIVVVSGGGKTPGRQIPRLLEPIINGGYDFVQGSRYLKGGKRKNLPLHRKIGTRGYSFIFSLFARSRITDGSSGFRAFRKSIFQDRRINLWQPWLDTYELEPYLYFKVLRYGYKVTEVPVTIRYPDKGSGPISKMRWFTDWWRISRPIFYLGLGLKK